MSLMEYYEKTLFEITAELSGYNRRWEEKWRHTRKIYTLLYNINQDPKKGRKKAEWELIPLPSEEYEIAWQNKVKTWEDSIKLELDQKGKR